jgi:hypothetical protein
MNNSSRLSRRTAIAGLAAVSCAALVPLPAVAAPGLEDTAEAALAYLEGRGYGVTVNVKYVPAYFCLGIIGVKDSLSRIDSEHVDVLYKLFKGHDTHPRLVDLMVRTGRSWSR